MENYFQTNEWLNQRLGRFTASEIHKLFTGGRRDMTQDELDEEKARGGKRKTVDIVFGDVAMRYIRTKAAEILTQEVKEEVNFKQGEWGKANEPECCKLFEKIIGVDGEHYGASNPTFFPFGEYEGCSPDWEWRDDMIGAEFKCPYDSGEHLLNLMINSQDDLKKQREDYYGQIQFSILRRGWVKSFFVSYDPRMAIAGQRIKIITIYPDVDWQIEYLKKIVLAIEELRSMINKVMALDFTLVYRDVALNATIVEPASILQKVV